MAQDVFVDVAYRGLELGRRLKLREVGPATAYLEHAAPMPVGAALVILTDEGHSIPAVVIRVHEQVAGADMPPGMRVRAQGLEGAAAEWWRGLVSHDDPVLPEPEVRPEARPHAPVGRQEPVQPDDTVVMMAVPPPPEGPSESGADEEEAQASGRTTVMSAIEIKDITDSAGDEDEGEAEGPAPGSNGEERPGQARGRRKRRRR